MCMDRTFQCMELWETHHRFHSVRPNPALSPLGRPLVSSLSSLPLAVSHYSSLLQPIQVAAGAFCSVLLRYWKEIVSDLASDDFVCFQLDPGCVNDRASNHRNCLGLLDLELQSILVNRLVRMRPQVLQSLEQMIPQVFQCVLRHE